MPGHDFMAFCQRWGASLSFFEAWSELPAMATRVGRHIRHEQRITVFADYTEKPRTLQVGLPEHAGAANVRPPSFEVDVTDAQ